MSVLIGLGILVWVLLAIAVAFVVARVTKLRNQQSSNRVMPGPPGEITFDGNNEPSRERVVTQHAK